MGFLRGTESADREWHLRPADRHLNRESVDRVILDHEEPADMRGVDVRAVHELKHHVDHLPSLDL